MTSPFFYSNLIVGSIEMNGYRLLCTFGVLVCVSSVSELAWTADRINLGSELAYGVDSNPELTTDLFLEILI